MCIINYWPTSFRNLYGGKWPITYCAMDTETTGYSASHDVIVEWGHCLVEDGVVTNQLSMVLDWSNHAVVPDHWLRRRLTDVRDNMARDGKSYHLTYDLMRAKGVPAAEGLAFIRDYTATLAEKGILFVLHNGAFDERMIAANFQGFKIADGFSLGDNGYLDTSAIEKASQVPANPRMHPRARDTLRDYFARVSGSRISGVRSNLGEHCFEKYKFKEKYGLDASKMHGAKMDAYCVHLLMQEFGDQITDGVRPLPLGVGEVSPARLSALGAANSAPRPTPLGANQVRLRKQRVN